MATRSTLTPGELHAQLESRLAAAKAGPRRARSPRRRSERRGSAFRRFAAVLAAAALLALSSFVVMGVHDLTFQLDRDAVDNGSGDDWGSLYSGGGTAVDFTGVIADIGADGGTQFHGGGSKDDLDITEWLWTDGEPLDKDDITNAYAAAYLNTIDSGENDIGDLIVYFGLDRHANNGTAQVGFWFLQNPVGLTDTASKGGFEFSGSHADHDILVQSNFTNGGVISRVTVYEWLNGGLVELFSAADCIGDSPADDAACATVNQADALSPWPYVPKFGTSGTFPAGSFFEGGINITDLVPDAGCFTGFIAETRSSAPFDAVLKDFAMGEFDLCGSVEASKYLDVNGNGADDDEPALTGWTMSLYEDENGNGAIDAEDDLLDSGATAGAGGSVTFDGLDAGDYIVCETVPGATPPWVNTDPGDATLCKAVTVTLATTSSVAFGNGQPAISVTKSCDADVFVGDTIDYTITVTNTGNVNLVNVDVEDDLLGTIASDQTLAVGASLVYNPTDAADAAGTVTNTVDVTADYGGATVFASVDDSDSCSTEVWELSVEKDASTSLDRDYDWDIAKTRVIVEGEDDGDDDPATLTLAEGQAYTVSYEVTVTMTGSTDSNWGVAGTITIDNPAPIAANGVSVTDVISVGINATVDCDAVTAGNQSTVGVPAESSAACSYSAALPDGTNRTNTATATLFGEEYSDTVDVLFDESTTVGETDECIDVADDNGTPADMTDDTDLGTVCVEDLDENDSFTFDLYEIEIGPFECGEAEFTNTASFATSDQDGEDDDTGSASYVIAIDVPCPEGCTLTLGYWKTHNFSFHDGMAAPPDDTWLLLGDADGDLADEAEGETFFLSGQTYYQVLWTAGGGNAYYQLARQYIAAELNVLNGADDSAIATAFADATTLFETYTPAEIGALKGKDALRQQFITLAGTLGSYNEGLIGPGHCDEDGASVLTAASTQLAADRRMGLAVG